MVFIQLLRKRKWLVVVTVSLSVLSILITLWWNYNLSIIINMIQTKNTITSMRLIKAILIIVLSAGSMWTFRMLSRWTCETLSHDLRMGYARKLHTQSILTLEQQSVGDALSKLQHEIAEVSSYLCNHLFQVIDDGIRFILTFTWLLFLDWKLMILAHIPLVFIFVYITWSSRVIEKFSNQSQEANKKMGEYIDTLLQVFPMLQLFDSTAFLCKEYKKILETWDKVTKKEERTKAKLMSFSAILSCIPLILLFFIGGTYVIHGTESVGVLYIMINLSASVSGITMNLSGRMSMFRRFLVNMRRLRPYILI